MNSKIMGLYASLQFSHKDKVNRYGIFNWMLRWNAGKGSWITKDGLMDVGDELVE